MFGLGMPEILMILAIALIVIGPKKLPDLAKTLGRAMGEFKRSAQDFKRSIDVETTVKEFKNGIDIPKADLNKLLTDPPSNDEAADTDQEKTATAEQEKADTADQRDSDFLDPDKKIPDNNGDDSSEDNNSDKADHTSDTDKIDK
ncbi:MAG: twin-arginine translocase TatA/TatE family subunit [Desulfobacula sp.]|jgi:sec-independent protein translocase protein TatB|nr:twin-arginine translocase TatA/TatE family subunit [Desulfobacula sp.]